MRKLQTLRLSKETLRLLDEDQLAGVDGGMPATTPTPCKSDVCSAICSATPRCPP
jgi:hypothetical protein